MQAVLKDNTIHLTGFQNGNKISKRFTLDGSPWKQLFTVELRSFVVSYKASTSFWLISPDVLDIVKFVATKHGLKTVVVRDRRYEAQHVKITFAGLLSVFWKGDFWYRQSDGTYLLYRGNHGPGTPIANLELIQE